MLVRFACVLFRPVILRRWIGLGRGTSTGLAALPVATGRALCESNWMRLSGRNDKLIGIEVPSWISRTKTCPTRKRIRWQSEVSWWSTWRRAVSEVNSSVLRFLLPLQLCAREAKPLSRSLKDSERTQHQIRLIEKRVRSRLWSAQPYRRSSRIS